MKYKGNKDDMNLSALIIEEEEQKLEEEQSSVSSRMKSLAGNIKMELPN